MAWRAPELGREEALELFAARLRAVRAEVVIGPEGSWKELLAAILAAKAPESVAYGPGAWFAAELPGVLASAGIAALPHEGCAEEFREALFGADASVTTARAGVAETGALVIIPDAGEPRLLSLVPPLHVAMVKARDIHATFAGAIGALGLAGGMPPNMVLVSGPSKTADIELTLTFGVHGPKELAVIVLT
jgi:L-lactate dehydrogenase complex protein LldG